MRRIRSIFKTAVVCFSEVNPVALELEAAGSSGIASGGVMTGIPLSTVDRLLDLLVKLMTLALQYAKLKEKK